MISSKIQTCPSGSTVWFPTLAKPFSRASWQRSKSSLELPFNTALLHTPHNNVPSAVMWTSEIEQPNPSFTVCFVVHVVRLTFRPLGSCSMDVPWLHRAKTCPVSTSLWKQHVVSMSDTPGLVAGLPIPGSPTRILCLGPAPSSRRRRVDVGEVIRQDGSCLKKARCAGSTTNTQR